MNLVIFKAEQAPFLFTYEGTSYHDKNSAQYIKDNKLQRGQWRELDTENDFLGYNPPDPTVYTGISGGYYCLFFSILYATHFLALFIMKKIISKDFRKANIFEQLLHSAESTNFAFSMNDWDFEKSGGPDEHYSRMKDIRVEVILNIIINFVANIILLTPLTCLCE